MESACLLEQLSTSETTGIAVLVYLCCSSLDKLWFVYLVKHTLFFLYRITGGLNLPKFEEHV